MVRIYFFFQSVDKSVAVYRLILLLLLLLLYYYCCPLPGTRYEIYQVLILIEVFYCQCYT